MSDAVPTSVLLLVLGKADWSSLKIISGNAESVPERYLALLGCGDDQDAERRYWQLDNHVVVQGRAFDSAPALLPAIFLTLSVATIAAAARRWVVELLTEIVLSRGHESEPGARLIESQIKAHVMENIAVVCGLLVDDNPLVRRAAVAIVDRIDFDSEFRRALLEHMADDVDSRVAAEARRSLGA